MYRCCPTRDVERTTNSTIGASTSKPVNSMSGFFMRKEGFKRRSPWPDRTAPSCRAYLITDLPWSILLAADPFEVFSAGHRGARRMSNNKCALDLWHLMLPPINKAPKLALCIQSVLQVG